MRVVRSVREMTRLSAGWRSRGLTVGFVPTMGALHAGHLALIRRARRDNARVIVSVFVNPLQFDPHEDFARYPRPLAQDLRLARRAGADALFYPTVAAMYPRGHATTVEVRRLTAGLCGRFRPGHFRGVTTVVMQLFAITQPSSAYFGQKDAQQALVIRRMARDLHLPLTIRLVPTVRDTDGLACSSRNAYLTLQQRQAAVRLYHALRQARTAIRGGERNASRVRRRALAFLRQGGRIRPDYVELVDFDELRPLRRLRGRVLIAVAAWVGRTRLIDNVVVSV